jgi:hypothetical protein
MIISAWSTEPFDLGNGGEARNVDGIWADGNFFRVLQIQPVLGRVDQWVVRLNLKQHGFKHGVNPCFETVFAVELPEAF